MEHTAGSLPRGSFFPIVETYGFKHDSKSPVAASSWKQRHCPFSNIPCEKYRQYRLGYCSVTYSAEWDKGVPHTYAVCDHRLDGAPVDFAVRDHFGTAPVTLVPEVTATSKPKLNLDYVAYSNETAAPGGTDLIAIETQAIDLRGGGVGPAFEAWAKGDVANWRRYFSEEAALKERRDTVDYGINVGNVYKRLGLQIATKGSYLKEIKVPLYVIMQSSVLAQLRSRIKFSPIHRSSSSDITFLGFEYGSAPDSDGRYVLQHTVTVRTSLSNYVSALTSGWHETGSRDEFISRVQKKASSLSIPTQGTLF